MTLCLGNIIGDWKAAHAFGVFSSSVSTVIVVTWYGILFLQYRIASGIVSRSADTKSGGR